MNVFQVFKIIFGIIISAFVLYFMVFYLGNYTDVQENARSSRVMKNLLKLSNDVYLTGIPAEYPDISFAKGENFWLDSQEPESISSELGQRALGIPIFFFLSGEAFIERKELDMVWYSFGFVEAVPSDMRIVFNPLNSDWGIAKNIVANLPNTEDFDDSSVYYYVCDGGKYLELCPEGCEMDEFLFNTGYISGEAYSKCTATLMPNSRLVEFSNSCSGSREICIEPPNSDGIGNMVVAGETLLYKDPADIAAVIIGGKESNIWGEVIGKQMYDFKNNMFRKRVGIAAEIMSERAKMISKEKPSCEDYFLDFSFQLGMLMDILDESDYYTTFGQATDLVETLKEVKSEYNQLVSTGCDYGF